METIWYYLKTPGNSYQLNQGPYSQNNRPFSYVMVKESLMTSYLHTGSYILAVDSITKDVMTSMGWNLISEDYVLITSPDIPETGIASAYDSHSFSVNSSLGSLPNPGWVLKYRTDEGILKTDTLANSGTTYTLPAISDPSQYLVNQDGYIEMSLTFIYQQNNQHAQSRPFKIYLGLKPIITEAEVIEKVDNAPYDSYNAHYAVKYKGASSIKVSVEQEYNPKLHVKIIKEPYIAYGIADNLFKSGYTWIDFTAENQFGKSYYTLEIEPYDTAYEEGNISNVSVRGLGTAQRIIVCDILGNTVLHSADRQQLRNLPANRIFIVKEYHNGEIIKTYKYSNR